jgi:hypothetical protein
MSTATSVRPGQQVHPHTQDQSWLPCLPGLPPNPVRHSCVVVTSGCCSCMLPLFAIRHKRVPASGTAGRQQERKEGQERECERGSCRQACCKKMLQRGGSGWGKKWGSFLPDNKRLAASTGGEARRRAGKESSAGGHSGRRALLAGARLALLDAAEATGLAVFPLVFAASGAAPHRGFILHNLGQGRLPLQVCPAHVAGQAGRAARGCRAAQGTAGALL